MRMKSKRDSETMNKIRRRSSLMIMWGTSGTDEVLFPAVIVVLESVVLESVVLGDEVVVCGNGWRGRGRRGMGRYGGNVQFLARLVVVDSMVVVSGVGVTSSEHAI